MPEVKVAVIVPYYQRESGILRRALASVSRQQRTHNVSLRIFVADDSSPVPANSEVRAATLPQSVPVDVLQRANGGPGAARNTALDVLPEDTSYVAFLDSDDEWSDDHLANAVHALESGGDFYFANHYQLEQGVGAFERAHRIHAMSHAVIGPDTPWLHRYEGNMRDQIITGNVIGTSTVVYRWAIARHVRFREEYRNAGEDYLFWLDLVSLNSTIVFSERCECRYGKGVNVFSGARWGSTEALDRTKDEIKYHKAISDGYVLTQAQRNHLSRAIGALRRKYALNMFHRLVRLQPIGRHRLWSHFRSDPMSFLQLPWNLLQNARLRWRKVE